MRKLLISIGIFAILGASGCSVYRVDIQQGNIIDKDELDKLKTGMSKKQVLYLIGNPLIQDPFHKDRWDYVYTYKQGENGQTTKKRLTLFFKSDKLQKIDNRGYPNTR